MFGKRTVLVTLVTAGLVVSALAVAGATPPSPTGFTSVQIGRGQAARSFEAHQRKGNDVAVNQITGGTRRVLGLALAPRHHRRRRAVRSDHAIQRADRRRQVPGPHLRRRAGVPGAPQHQVQRRQHQQRALCDSGHVLQRAAPWPLSDRPERPWQLLTGGTAGGHGADDLLRQPGRCPYVEHETTV